MEKFLKKDDVVKKEMAISLLQDFVKHWTHKKPSVNTVEEDYPEVLIALQKGNFTIDTNHIPKHVLVFPIGEKGGKFSIEEIDFKTRIKPTTLADITKGVNITKEQIAFTLRCMAYIAQFESVKLLDKLEKFDYKVLEQTSTIFF